MADMKKVALTAIPVAIVAAIGVVAQMLKKKEGVTEEVKETTRDALKDLDSTFNDLKNNLQGKSASQLERTLDNAVEATKKQLDKMASQMRARLKHFELKGRSFRTA